MPHEAATELTLPQPRIAAILPCYRSRDHVLDVLKAIGPEVSHIVVVDDACPDGTGDYVQQSFLDDRLTIVRHGKNLGVGGAVKSGYRAALALGCDIFVKVDSDGQMDPRLIPSFVKPIANGTCDYVKGNRFFNPEDIRQMPLGRTIGNLGLSFLTKLSTGYWNVFDPTNGYTAIHRTALSELPLDKISDRFFFETDMLFRLNLSGALVVDLPMAAKYATEVSNLSPLKSLFEFSARHMVIFAKRVIYRYYLRDFNFGSVSLVIALPLLAFGVIFGLINWINSAYTRVPTTAGTVMLAALPVILGFHLLLNFFAQDYNSVPRIPIQRIR